MRIAWLFLSVATLLPAQDPFQVAGDHYHLQFENAWARSMLVTYQPLSKAATHNHPPAGTVVYLYVTDSGPLQFRHIAGHNAGHTFTRRAVKAGQIRFSHGGEETHATQYMGDAPSSYVRIELRTDPVEKVRDARLPPAVWASEKSATQVQYENPQLRIVRVLCGAGDACPATTHPGDAAIVVPLTGEHRGETQWRPAGAPQTAERGPLELVRVELKTKTAPPDKR